MRDFLRTWLTVMGVFVVLSSALFALIFLFWIAAFFGTAGIVILGFLCLTALFSLMVHDW